MNSRKIKAFTVLEMMVVMLLTAIVVALAYSGSALFYKEYLLYQQRTNNTAFISLMDRLLNEDFSRSEVLVKNRDGLTCYHREKKVNYLFRTNYWIRKDSMVIDTFHYTMTNSILSFNGENAQEGRLVDALTFELKNKEEVLYFNYHKAYSSEVLINKSGNYNF